MRELRRHIETPAVFLAKQSALRIALGTDLLEIVDIPEIHRPVRDRRTRNRKRRSDDTTQPQSRGARRPDDGAVSMNVARIRPRKRKRSDDLGCPIQHTSTFLSAAPNIASILRRPRGAE